MIEDFLHRHLVKIDFVPGEKMKVTCHMRLVSHPPPTTTPPILSH